LRYLLRGTSWFEARRALWAAAGKAIRDVAPAALIILDSHERDVTESAAFWSDKATHSHQTYDHYSDKNTSRNFRNALEPAELLPRYIGEERLIPRYSR